MIENFLSKDFNIFKDTAFLTNDLNMVKKIHYLYGENLYYYLRNNIWIITSTHISNLNNTEILKDNLIIKKILLNTKINLQNSKSLDYGFGWDKQSNGLASNGYYSSILFKVDNKNCSENFYLNLGIENYFKEIKGDFNLYLNNKILTINNLNLIPLNINCENINNHHVLEFKYKKPISLRELNRGLNHSKRSIILNEIEIIN